ncbi:hypothetical protein AB0E69_25030 [Kribbella sp. NPDC026611]|uniref:hypothetical protein n=1 Tax=Kribbella sp. NPDC026611 TaxID=3154911 RepID=UPI0033EA0B90
MVEKRRRNWWALAGVSLVAAGAVGFAAAYVMMVGIDRLWAAERCEGEPDCLEGLWALGIGLLAGALAVLVTVVVFAVKFHLGKELPIGTAVAVVLGLAGLLQYGPSDGRMYLGLAAAALVAAVTIGGSTAR